MQISSHVSIFVDCRKKKILMKIKLIMTGKTNVGWVESGIGLYAGRLKHYVNFSMVEIPDIRNTSSMSRELVKAREGDLQMKNIAPSDHVILLDEKGAEFTSAAWAAKLESRISHSSGDIVFIIGGAYGFSDSVYARADEKLSLSRMTFSHQMVRAIFLEQLYRAFTIMRGEPYHHE